MNDMTKFRIWMSLAIPLFLLAALLFFGALLSYPSFRKPDDGYIAFLQILPAISIVPLVLFSLGTICSKNSKQEPTKKSTVPKNARFLQKNQSN